MRLFIALDLPEPLLPLLAEAGDVLRDHADKISLTQPHNLHLTLRFLGEVGEERLPDLRQLIIKVPMGGQVALSHYGSFGTPDGLTLWAGLHCDKAVLTLARAVEEGVRLLGFPAETRAFVPHVTLARRARLNTPLLEIMPLLPLHPEPLLVPALTLYQSVLGREGPVYTALERAASARQ